MPRKWILSPEERAHQAVERMSLGSIKGQVQSAAPYRPQRAGALASTAPAGSTRTIGSLADQIASDDGDLICDASPQDFTPAFTSPPDWLDTSGNILTPGLYVAAYMFRFGTVGGGLASTEKITVVSRPFAGYAVGEACSDALDLTLAGNTPGYPGTLDVTALGASDLPFSLRVTIGMPGSADSMFPTHLIWTCCVQRMLS